MGFYSSAGRSLQRERKGHGYETRRSPEILSSGYFAIASIAINTVIVKS